MNDKKQDALGRLAVIEVETAKLCKELRKIIEAPAEAPDPRLSWIGKWGFYNNYDPECPDDGLMGRLEGVDPGRKPNDLVIGGCHFRYFRPATPEELGVTPTIEPSIEPDWSKAPEWARYWARDESGATWWYEKEPHKDSDCLWLAFGRSVHAGIYPCWGDSMRKRPEATK